MSSLSTSVAGYLPKHIGEKILANKHQLEGERKVISALFADVVNYTSFAEKLDVEVVREIMNTYFKMLIELVCRYEGVVAQLLGDGIMVFFGAPLAHEDHAQRACYSALALQAATREYSESVQKQYGIDFKVRVGVNSGPVFVGTIGNDLHMEYLAIGNTVNLASRIQNAASPGCILVSGNTYYLVKYFFNFETIRDVAIKGKEEPIEAYELLDAKKTESRFDAAVLKGLSRFCGRAPELAGLNKVLSKVENGNGQVVGIMGEPGIGKSRLIREFRESLTPGEGTFFEGRCLHYGNSIPFKPLIDILRSFFKIEEGDTESRTKEKIIAKARQLDEQMVSDLAFIYEIFFLNIEDKSYFNIEPEHRRNKMFSTITRLLAKESSRQPVIIVIEDLHWIDEISEELLAYLIQKLKNSPILFLLSYRPEYAPSWKNQPGYSQIHLSQLSPPNSSELLQSLLSDGEPAPELATLVLAQAGGNPLFVEEYTYTLLEEGTIRKDDGHYSLNALPSSIKLPDTLQGIIASRIDRLPEALKNTLQVASVIGRDFSYEVLRAVLQKPQKLRNQLENLENLEFIVEGSVFSETEYTFKHALIQEVAYGGLSNKKQQELHENVARVIEKLYPDRLEEFLDVLAYHFRNGLSSDKALDYSIRAGNRAQATFANQAAIEYFKKALELCPKFGLVGDGIGATLHENLGDIYLLTGKSNQALESYESSYQLYVKFEDSVNNTSKGSTAQSETLSKHLPTPVNRQERLATLYFNRSQICVWKRQDDEGLNWTDKGLILSEISDRIKARLLWARSTLFMQRGEYTPALDYCRKAVEYAHKIHDEIEATAYNYMGYIYNQSGDSKSAADCYQRALDIAIRFQKPNPEAEALDSLAICFSISGDWKRAENYYKKSLSISEKIGSIYLQARSLTNYSDILIRRGHVEELEESITCNIKALDIRGESGRESNWVIYSNLSWASLKLGKMQKAKEYGNESLAILEQGFSKFWLWQGYLAIAEVHLGLGEIETALDLCQKSLDIVIETKSVLGQCQVPHLMGRIYHRMGQWDKAEDMLKNSLRSFENINTPPDEMALTFWHLAILYHDMNEANFKNIPRATIRELIKRAEGIFERLDISYDKALAQRLSEA
jgi:class 3 adenylate cyclase/tetratricopeptide (TPR) repeat protein